MSGNLTSLGSFLSKNKYIGIPIFILIVPIRFVIGYVWCTSEIWEDIKMEYEELFAPYKAV